MSYIELAEEVPPTRKLMLSLFFRVPHESIGAAAAEYQAWKDSGVDRPVFCGIIPLVVLGGARSRRKFDIEQRSVGPDITLTHYLWDTVTCGWQEQSSNTVAQEAAHYVFKDEDLFDIDPSYIGIDCATSPPRLAVNILMPSEDVATMEGALPQIQSISGPGAIGIYSSTVATDTCTPPVGNHVIGDGSNCFGVLPFNDIDGTVSYEGGASVALASRPEQFRTLPLNGDGEFVGELFRTDPALFGKTVAPDVWHHVLLSLDLSRKCIAKGVIADGDGEAGAALSGQGDRTTSACRMYIAFDDVNLTGKTLSAYYPDGYEDRNAVLTVNGYYTASYTVIDKTVGPVDDCFGNAITTHQVNLDVPSYSYTPSQFDPGAPSLPASGTYVDAVKHVEMAALRMFTDVALDTSVLEVRRAFVTDKGKPASVGKASKLLGRKPEVLIDRIKDWQEGRNVGTLAGDDPPDGVAVGRIKPFKPNPKLGD